MITKRNIILHGSYFCESIVKIRTQCWDIIAIKHRCNQNYIQDYYQTCLYSVTIYNYNNNIKSIGAIFSYFTILYGPKASISCNGYTTVPAEVDKNTR